MARQPFAHLAARRCLAVGAMIALARGLLAAERPGTPPWLPGSVQGAAPTIDFVVSYDLRGLAGLAASRDPYGAQVLAPNARLGVVLKYRVEGGDWLGLYQTDPVKTAPSPETVVLSNDVDGTVLKSAQTFRTDGRVLDWTIDVANRTQEPIEIGDFALSLPRRAPGGEDPEAIFEKSWTKHQFISGHGSFLQFVRPNGEPPYLVAPRSLARSSSTRHRLAPAAPAFSRSSSHHQYPTRTEPNRQFPAESSAAKMTK